MRLDLYFMGNTFAESLMIAKYRYGRMFGFVKGIKTRAQQIHFPSGRGTTLFSNATTKKFKIKSEKALTNGTVVAVGDDMQGLEQEFRLTGYSNAISSSGFNSGFFLAQNKYGCFNRYYEKD